MINTIDATDLNRNQNRIFQSEIASWAESEAQSAFQYFLEEVERDDSLSHEEQHHKIQEFKNVADSLSPHAQARLTCLLIEETCSRILNMVENARARQSRN